MTVLTKYPHPSGQASTQKYAKDCLIKPRKTFNFSSSRLHSPTLDLLMKITQPLSQDDARAPSEFYEAFNQVSSPEKMLNRLRGLSIIFENKITKSRARIRNGKDGLKIKRKSSRLVNLINSSYCASGQVEVALMAAIWCFAFSLNWEITSQCSVNYSTRDSSL